jgi:hypothetical protein
MAPGCGPACASSTAGNSQGIPPVLISHSVVWVCGGLYDGLYSRDRAPRAADRLVPVVPTGLVGRHHPQPAVAKRLGPRRLPRAAATGHPWPILPHAALTSQPGGRKIRGVWSLPDRISGAWKWKTPIFCGREGHKTPNTS